MNTSFSAMNSSLQAKWSAAKHNAAAKETDKLSNTMVGSQSTARLSGIGGLNKKLETGGDEAEALTRSQN